MSGPDALLAPSFVPLCMALAECFTAPSFATFQHLLAGWLLCTGRHTVTGVLRASAAVGAKHHTSFHRFFRMAAWCTDSVGLTIARLAVTLVERDAVIVAPIDDTLGRHTGKHIEGASMHHDPLLSTRTRAVFHWGHVWVVLSIAVRVAKWRKTFAVPVLVRLYRAEKVCRRSGRPFSKKTELGAEMIATLARAMPERRFRIVGDANFANASIMKTLSPNVDFIGRSRLDAALYAPAPRRKRMGRPPLKGGRVASPGERAGSSAGWQRLRVDVYGRTVGVKVKLFDALWYTAGGNRLLRFVLVRGWPGHAADDVFCCTDLTLEAQTIIESYCLRWSLEVTFHEAKGKLGFEDPQNRTARAVERTAPMALWAYGLTVLWYLTRPSKGRSGGLLPELPWYRKTTPSFADMLAELRREAWRHRLSQSAALTASARKSIAPILESLAYAA